MLCIYGTISIPLESMFFFHWCEKDDFKKVFPEMVKIFKTDDYMFCKLKFLEQNNVIHFTIKAFEHSYVYLYV